MEYVRQQTYTLSEQETKWLDKAMVELAYSAKDQDEHYQWIKSARARLRELYGITAKFDQCPEWVEKESKPIEGLKWREVSHKAYDGQWRDHIIVEPSEPIGVVIALADECLMEDIIGYDKPSKPTYSSRAIGMELVKSGFAVVAAGLRGFGRDLHPNKFGYPGIYVTSCAYTGLGKDDLATVYAKDSLQTVSMAESIFKGLPIGFAGLSKSGMNTAIVAALSEKISAAYVGSGCSHDRFSGMSTAVHKYVRGFLQWFWTPDLLCMIAPRPLRLSYGLQENFIYAHEARNHESLDYGLMAYRNCSANERISQLTHDGGHEFVSNDVTEFFKANMRNVSQL